MNSFCEVPAGPGELHQRPGGKQDQVCQLQGQQAHQVSRQATHVWLIGFPEQLIYCLIEGVDELSDWHVLAWAEVW